MPELVRKRFNNQMKRLSNKQKFSVFRQWPERVIDDELEFVYLVAYLIKLRLYGIVVRDSLFVFVGNLVGYLAGIDKFLYSTLYS